MFLQRVNKKAMCIISKRLTKLKFVCKDILFISQVRIFMVRRTALYIYINILYKNIFFVMKIFNIRKIRMACDINLDQDYCNFLSLKYICKTFHWIITKLSSMCSF